MIFLNKNYPIIGKKKNNKLKNNKTKLIKKKKNIKYI